MRINHTEIYISFCDSRSPDSNLERVGLCNKRYMFAYKHRNKVQRVHDCARRQGKGGCEGAGGGGRGRGGGVQHP